MTHPYRDVPQEITAQHVWLAVYQQWINKHAEREDVTFDWKMRSAEEVARRAAVAFREAFGDEP